MKFRLISLFRLTIVAALASWSAVQFPLLAAAIALTVVVVACLSAVPLIAFAVIWLSDRDSRS